MTTRKKPTKSPQNSRLFPAILSWTLLSVRWGVLISIIGVNIILFRSVASSSWWKQRLSILSDPTSSLVHTQLAQMYWQAGQKTAAQQEIRLAQDILTSESGEDVLGLSIQQEDLTSDWQKETERLLHAYSYWQSVIGERPDYRDAYIQLAYLAYLLRFDTEASQYINKVVTVDPTYSENLISHLGKK